MGSDQLDGDSKVELNDSGCIQDEPPPKQAAEENGYVGQAQLLDLSDDVLLYILRYCSPQDLKALGFTCARLGSLVLERSLWTRIDSREVSVGRARLKWMLDHAVHAGTKELLVTGLAEQAKGCRGHTNKTRKEVEEEELKHKGDGDACSHTDESGREGVNAMFNGREAPHPFLHFTHMPRMSTSPCWADSDSESEPGDDLTGELEATNGCFGPVFTLGRRGLIRLRSLAPQLTALHLDYCNINCIKTNLSIFPPTLKKLSLRGTKCYNLPLDKSFLFKIHDYLPVLEYLDLSECDWLEPANLLPLSKMTSLLTLLMRECQLLSEFVAYISLASRYGFSKLKVLDVRGSPVGDSEVSALGWLPALEELHLSAPLPPSPPATPHHHYHGERGAGGELAPWETQVPEYYNITKDHQEGDVVENNGETIKDDSPSVKITRNSLNIPKDLKEELNAQQKRKMNNCFETDDQAGPSKRFRNENNEEDINKSIENMQNSNISITKNNGYVTFKRTINNSNSSQNNDGNDKNSDDSKNDSEDSRNGSFDSTNYSSDSRNETSDSRNFSEGSVDSRRFATRININLNDGPSTSSFAVRFRVNNDSDNDSEASSNDDKDTNDKSKESNETPAKKAKLESHNESSDEANDSESNNESRNSENENRNVENENRSNENENRNVGNENRNVGNRNRNCANVNDNERPQFVRFRRNQPFEIVPMPEQAQPRHQILYVNLGRQVHAVFSGPMLHCNRHNRFTNHPTPLQRVEFSTLVSDSAIRRFGRADGEDVNIVNIGPNGPQFGGRDTSGRPNRSNLRVLSATGYRNITNRSLVHLATAAPFLRRVDFSNTNVTENGVEEFKSLRPECEVIFSEFKESEG